MKEARNISKFRHRKVRRVRRWLIKDVLVKSPAHRVRQMRADRPWRTIVHWRNFHRVWNVRTPRQYRGLLLRENRNSLKLTWGLFLTPSSLYFEGQNNLFFRRLSQIPRFARLLRRRRLRRRWFTHSQLRIRRKARYKGRARRQTPRRVKTKHLLGRRKFWVKRFLAVVGKNSSTTNLGSARHSLLQHYSSVLRARRSVHYDGRRRRRRRNRRSRRSRWGRWVLKKQLTAGRQYGPRGWGLKYQTKGGDRDNLTLIQRHIQSYRQKQLLVFRRYLGVRKFGVGVGRGVYRRGGESGQMLRQVSKPWIGLLGSPLVSSRVPQGWAQRHYSVSVEWRPVAAKTQILDHQRSFFPALQFLAQGGVLPALPVLVQDRSNLAMLFPWWFHKQYGGFDTFDLRGGVPSLLTTLRQVLTAGAVNDSLAFNSQIFSQFRQRATALPKKLWPNQTSPLSNREFLSSLVSLNSSRRQPRPLNFPPYLEFQSLSRRLSYYRQIVRNLRLNRRFTPSSYYLLQLKWGLLTIYDIDFMHFRRIGLIRVRSSHPSRSLNVWFMGQCKWWGGFYHSFRALADRYSQYEGERMVQQDYYLGAYLYRRYRGSLVPFVQSAYMTFTGLGSVSGDVAYRNTQELPGFGFTTPRSVVPTWGGSHDLLLADIRYIQLLFNHPILLKYFLWSHRDRHQVLPSVVHPRLFIPTISDMQHMHFSKRVNIFQTSNLWPTAVFSHTIRRRLLKVFTYRQFNPEMTMWVHHNLVRFMEAYSGRKVYLQFNAFAENALTYHDLARCYLWERRLRSFQRMLGARIFVNESLRIFYLALKSHDPKFLAIWIREMLYRLSFWKSRLLFRYIKYIMKYLFYPCRSEIGFRGLKLTLRGKIAVAGNARTRTLIYAIGDTSNSKMNNRVVSHFTTVNSFTGVMGFNLLFYF